MAIQQMKIDLTAKDKTGNAFRSLNARLEKTRKVAKSVVGVVAKVGAAAVALGAGFAVATKKAIDFAASIGRTAREVNVSTKALQKYRFAAELVGIANEELDDAFRTLNELIGEAVNEETGAAFEAFQQLGIASDILSGKLRGTEPVFLAVVDSLNQIEDKSRRAALSAIVFGGEAGLKLANLTNQGTAAIKAAGDEFERLDGLINNKTIKSAEAAAASIAKLSTIMKSKLTKALAENAPLIADFGKDLLENLPKIIDGLRNVAKFLGIVGLSSSDQLKKSQETIDKLMSSNAKLENQMTGLNKPFSNKQLDIMAGRMLKIEQERKIIKEITAERVKQSQALQNSFVTPPRAPGGNSRVRTLVDIERDEDAKKANDDFVKLISDSLDKIKTIRADILKSAQDTAAAAGLELEYANASEAVKNRALAVAQIENRLKAEGITLSDVQREQLEAALDLTQQRQQTLALIKLDEQARIEAAEKLKETQRQANDLIRTGLQSMQDGLTGLIDGTQTWKQALGGVLRTVINIAAKMGETSTGGFSFGKLASGLGSLFGGGSVVGGQPIPVTGQSGGFPIMHTGGKIAGPNGRMAGLRSDERMIVGQTGERVLSRGQTAQGDSGGVVINQTINLSTGVQQTVRAEVMSLAPQIAAQAKAAVLDAKKRGGGFGAAFA